MRKLLVALVAGVMLASIAVPALAVSVPCQVYGTCNDNQGGNGQGGNGQGGNSQGNGPKDIGDKDTKTQSAINSDIKSGIFKGYTDGNFHPDDQVTLGQAITVALRLAGQNPTNAQGDDWAANAKQMAANSGLIDQKTAISDSNTPVTRLSVFVVLAKLLGLQPSTNVVGVPWSDVSGTDATTLGYLIALHDAGIVHGFPDGTVHPGETLTRAQMAILVDNILHLSSH